MSGSRRPIAVALGGNLGGERRIVARFRAAVRLLEAAGAYDLIGSRLYRSAAAGPIRDQPRFLNAVVAFRWPGADPIELLVTLWAIERTLGRRRPARPRQGPRPIDLDLLLFAGQRRDTAVLVLPHPRIRQRPFVHRPLAEVS